MRLKTRPSWHVTVPATEGRFQFPRIDAQRPFPADPGRYASARTQLHRTFGEVTKSCRWRTNSHRETRKHIKATAEFEGTRMSAVDEMTNSKRKSCSSRNGNSIGVGVAIGVAIGAAYGASSGNMGQSVAMGVALGTALGAIFDLNQRRRSKVNNSRM